MIVMWGIFSGSIYRLSVWGILIGCVWVSGCSSGVEEVEREGPPNIVFIMTDDMGKDWVGAYGSMHETPNIDRLAEDGALFNQVYSTPLCTPTRHQLLTGRYPFRTGWVDHHDVPQFKGEGYFDWERELTCVRLLREAGYSTAIGGKWQINDLGKQPDALDKHGFSAHCVWPGVEKGNEDSKQRYWDPYLQMNGERKIHEGAFGPEVINGFLCDFIRENREKPFLVYYPLMLPHAPYVLTPDNKGEAIDKKDKKALYAGMATYVDKLVGNIMEAVHMAGVDKHTYIVFTADNGSSVAGVMKGGGKYLMGKGRFIESGINVPLIVKGPYADCVKGEQSALIDFSDWFPTFLELAGVALPKDVRIDGQSFAGLLSGEEKDGKRDWIYSQLAEDRTLSTGEWKLYSDGRFYHIAQDFYEQKDLQESTEAEVVAARERLRVILASFPKDTTPPFAPFSWDAWDGNKPARVRGE